MNFNENKKKKSTSTLHNLTYRFEIWLINFWLKSISRSSVFNLMKILIKFWIVTVIRNELVDRRLPIFKYFTLFAQISEFCFFSAASRKNGTLSFIESQNLSPGLVTKNSSKTLGRAIALIIMACRYEWDYFVFYQTLKTSVHFLHFYVRELILELFGKWGSFWNTCIYVFFFDKWWFHSWWS